VIKGRCALCKEAALLQDSHIIPKFVVRWLRQDSPGYLRSGTKPNRRIQDFHKLPLLCEPCEQKFSQWEKRFAESVFVPVHQNALARTALSLGPWGIRFLVSVSWRVGIFFKRETKLDHCNEAQRSEFNRALERWRLFLLGKTKSVGAHTQHCLPLSVVVNHSVPSLSPFFNRVRRRSVSD
jgi:hypothetical protein